MKRIASSLILLIGLFLLMQVQPGAQPKTPPFITCRNGGMIWQQPLVDTTQIVYKCIDPAYLGSLFTGSACDPPGTGVTVYAQLPDKTCLNLVAIPASGSIATPVTAEFGTTSPSGGPVRQIQYFYTAVTPAP